MEQVLHCLLKANTAPFLHLLVRQHKYKCQMERIDPTNPPPKKKQKKQKQEQETGKVDFYPLKLYGLTYMYVCYLLQQTDTLWFTL